MDDVMGTKAIGLDLCWYNIDEVGAEVSILSPYCPSPQMDQDVGGAHQVIAGHNPINGIE